ncbi:BOS complex subunit ncln [Microplitis mediator]|uniref:BOS complex subunit ncln n=1 Tax=Microplitis mediator TaxID=375433 RepID=UPI0025536EA1|nr:BOS complex subunit ncln [Microplitis mediator]
MWLEQCDSFAELCRSYLPYYLLIVLPIFIVVSPVNPVAASHELPVYRMHQYDLHGTPHGCRSASILLEGRGLSNWRTSRHCVITRLNDLTPDLFYTIKNKAGALIVMLPKDMTNLTIDEQQSIALLETTMLTSGEITIPIYFSPWNDNLKSIVNDLEIGFSKNEPVKSNSEVQSLIDIVSASGYQVIVSAGQPNPRNDVKIATIHGKLSGTGAEDKLPTIALVAYYDSSSVITELSVGAESNASGVSMLLELARIFSALYSISKSRPKFNIVFVLSGGGKLNYYGSKKWLEDQFDGLEGSVIQDAAYVICLDAVSLTNNLYLHVSKPPKENSFGYLFYNELKNVIDTYNSNNNNNDNNDDNDSDDNNLNLEGIHKKINLADESLAWEHERYSIRRLPAVTISSLRSHDNPLRTSILDINDLSKTKLDRLYRNTKLIGETLARRLYNLNSTEILSSPVEISKESLEVWFNYLTSQSRSVPILSDSKNSYNPLVNSLHEFMQRYLTEVKINSYSADKRDPEFVFYDNTKTIMNIYSVKPAIFDLFLTIAIAVYLSIIYLAVYKFSNFYYFVERVAGYKNKVA